MSELGIRIPADVVEAIAQRAAEILLERQEAAAAESSPYLSVKEAAAFLRCSPQRIYELRTSGRLSRITEGGRALVRRSELELLVVDEDLPSAARARRVA